MCSRLIPTNTFPMQPLLAKRTVPSAAEQKLKHEKHVAWLELMISHSSHDEVAQRSFKNELKDLQNTYKNRVSPEVIAARCAKLAQLKNSLRGAA